MPPSCALLGGFAIGARVALLWQHYAKCVAQPSGNPPGPLHAERRTHYACRRRLTPLAGDNVDAPAACAVPLRLYCGGVVTRTRYVSEYMLVLALRLVYNSIRRNCIARRQRAVSPAFSRPYRRLQASHHAGGQAVRRSRFL